MLASKMFATTLLSQQFHDTVCSVEKGRVRYRIGGEWLYKVVAVREEYTSYKSHFLLLYSSPCHYSTSHHTHPGPRFSHCRKKRCAQQHFSANTEYEIVKWVRKRWNPSLQCVLSMFWCVTDCLGGEWCEKGRGKQFVCLVQIGY